MLKFLTDCTITAQPLQVSLLFSMHAQWSTCLSNCVSVMIQTNSMSGGSSLYIVSRNGCKCKYRVRWFYSKGAFLVLVWVMLLTISYISVFHVLHQRLVSILYFQNGYLLSHLCLVYCWELFSQDAWLADVINLGNYKVMKYTVVPPLFAF